MHHPRRLSGLLAGVSLVAALAACGGTTDSPAEASPASTRSVDTAFGDVAVPERPTRVIALSEAALDTALELGTTPVGTTARRGGEEPPAYLGAEAAGIPVVATVAEPNVEEIVKAEPDLILAGAGLEKARYDALTAIAPTVVPDAGTLGWEDQLATYAEALGKETELAAKLDALEKRADAVAAAQRTGATAVVLRWMPNGPVVMSAGLMPSSVLADAGVAALPLAKGLGDKPHSDPLSLENLSQVDAGRLFIATFDADGKRALDAARKQPAFTRLNAAKAGAVSLVDGGVWSSSSGPIAWDRVLTDIERAYAG
ncbi:MAG TPA: iron-siderophore ABC transporter substrate-binding protein [Mycobacteriales bacterium]|jgi:iron complex transport system substrate-binding protein|nr:iron-siderophore ABC transporter substrate-binding protein [Mycobacteriales bacterium]